MLAFMLGPGKCPAQRTLPSNVHCCILQMLILPHFGLEAQLGQRVFAEHRLDGEFVMRIRRLRRVQFTCVRNI